MKRVVVYVPLELLRRLKSKLALQGLTISEWFRREAEKLLDKDE